MLVAVHVVAVATLPLTETEVVTHSPVVVVVDTVVLFEEDFPIKPEMASAIVAMLAATAIAPTAIAVAAATAAGATPPLTSPASS